METSVFLIQLLNSIQYGLLLFLLAAGLTLIFGSLNVVNLAHGSFYMVGAYLIWWLSEKTGNFFIALALGIPVAFLIGLVCERTIFRYFYSRPHLDHVLLTFGLIFVLEDARASLWGNDVHGVSVPDALAGSIQLTGNQAYPIYRIGMSLVCLVLALGLYGLLSHTRLGMKIRAGLFDRDMAGALGINISKINMIVFAIGVVLAAIAGMIAAPTSGVYPNMGADVLIICFVVVVIGGIGSIRGAFLASLLVGVVDTYGKILAPQVAGMLVYLLMAIVLLWRPQGLFKN